MEKNLDFGKNRSTIGTKKSKNKMIGYSKRIHANPKIMRCSNCEYENVDAGKFDIYNKK